MSYAELVNYSTQEKSGLLYNSFIATQLPLNEVQHEEAAPESFTWQGKVGPVTNQHDCGCCYSMSSVNTIADRGIIKYGYPKSLVLSTVFPMSCISNALSNGVFVNNNKSCDSLCNGGNAAQIYDFAKSTGLVENSCAPIEDVIKNSSVANYADYINKHYGCIKNVTSPNCSRDIKSSPCYAELEKNSYKISDYSHFGVTKDTIPTSSVILNNMKSEIVKNGPMTTSFAVFQDLMLLINPDALSQIATKISPQNLKQITNWNATNGIYIHGYYDQYLVDKTTNKPLELAYTTRDGKSIPLPFSQYLVGLHAVEVVGFGSDALTLFGQVVKVPYWIIKNSWGTEFMDNGYFKIAMFNPNIQIIVDPDTNKKVPLNYYLGIDFVVNEGNISVGGMLAPVVTKVQKSSNVKKWIIILVILLILGVVGYFVWKRKMLM